MCSTYGQARITAVAALLAFGAFACSGSRSDSPGLAGEEDSGPEVERVDPNRIISQELLRAESCDDAWRFLREQMMRQAEEAIDRARVNWLSTGSFCYVDAAMDADTDMDMDMDVDYADDSAGESAESYTTTNTQVEDVDEADFVKNDGGYIYILADGAFQIIDAWPAGEAHRIASYPLGGFPKKLYVSQDRAVIYSAASAYDYPCTYGYDCTAAAMDSPTTITVLDIRERTAPVLVREIAIDAGYLDSRRIGDAVYTVVVPARFAPEYYAVELPDELQPYACSSRDEIPFSHDEIRAFFDAHKRAELARIAAIDFSALLPEIRDTRYLESGKVEESGLLAGCRDFFLSQAGDATGLMIVAGFDIGADEPLTTATTVGSAGVVYASSEALYVAMHHDRSQTAGWFDIEAGETEATAVHKFGLDPATARAGYLGSGLVEGRVLNQFAMDEHEGDLRIATTSGYLPDPAAHNSLSVLAEADGGLALAGQIDQLAPGEDIRSVRFNGDVGYVVTFKKTDPLFVIDLADPTAPAVRGELKIPGFSTYMHFLDDAHLLTIGYDADDMGDFAWFDGIQLQIIDVSRPADPKLLFREIIGTRGTSSEAATNHLAFTYFREKGLLALPLTICQGGGDGQFGYQMTFSGLRVYRATVEDGFLLLGGVPHVPPATGSDYDTVCGNWWTESNTAVKRSLFMEDFVYSIAPKRIRVSDIADLGAPVADISLELP